VIKLENATVGFLDQIVLDSISCTIAKNDTTLVVGESGTGKSVLAKTIIGLIEPQKGNVFIDGENIYQLKKKEFWHIRKKMAMLFQNSALLDSFNVYQNVALPLVEHSQFSAEKILQIVNEKLNLVGLSDILHKMPSELSGGMRKRVALARAIILEPEYIIFDEPTTGLDPSAANDIILLIHKLQATLQVTSIIITHDLNCIQKTGGNLLMLQQGKIIFDGNWQDFKISRKKEIQKFLRIE
jgi:phospholipid/cholesterol/gamma-HCH transport system ATP-binding protein